MEYSLEQFEQDIQKIKPRFFDTYILPAFMLWFAIYSKKSMNRWPRRVLFTSGIYMLYRNYADYKKMYNQLFKHIDNTNTSLPQNENE